jgi:hypothetical protein
MGKSVLGLLNEAFGFATVSDEEHVLKFMGVESKAIQPASIFERGNEIIFPGGNNHIAGY